MLKFYPLYILGLISLFSIIFGILKYKNTINPFSFTIAISIFLFTIISSFSLIEGIEKSDIDEISIINYTYWMSITYLLGYLLPFFYRFKKLNYIYSNLLSILNLRSEFKFYKFSFYSFFLLLFCSFLLFICLAYYGEGGILWVTNPRDAYLFYRFNAGHFFALTQWTLTFSLLYYLWFRRPKFFELTLIILIWLCITYFLGSKSMILTNIIIGTIYYNFYVNKLTLFNIIFLFLSTLLFISCLIIIQRGSDYSIDFITIYNQFTNYFKEYFRTSALFLSRFDEFGLQYGKAFISSFWVLIPRFIYSDKPYEYGVSLVHQKLFPGLAEQGHTDGILEWTLFYLDFGICGVFFSALFIGIFHKIIYEYFLTHKNEFFAFTLMIHFAIIPIWSFATIPVVFFLCLLQNLYLRLKFYKTAIR
jgi:hypothetical protein